MILLKTKDSVHVLFKNKAEQNVKIIQAKLKVKKKRKQITTTKSEKVLMPSLKLWLHQSYLQTKKKQTSKVIAKVGCQRSRLDLLPDRAKLKFVLNCFGLAKIYISCV